MQNNTSQPPKIPNATVPTVLVPLANPATAHALLTLGLALANPDDGRVVGLIIMNDDNRNPRQSDELENIVLELQQQDKRLEMRSRNANRPARCIVDTAQEEGADTIILGLRQRDRGQVVRGSVVEDVITAAPCDVIIYRVGQSEEFERIVIPADGSTHARVACRVGIALGEQYDTPVEAVYVQPGYYPQWRGRGYLEASLAEIPGAAQVRRTVITADNPAQGVLARLNEDDLIVVGYSDRTRFERWLYGDFSQYILNESPCAVLMVVRSSRQPAFRAFDRLRLRLTPNEQEDITRQAYDMASVSLDYMALIVIAAALASFGLLNNSASVVIGAMLVAPFMQPCICFAVGIATRRLPLVMRALQALAVGIPLSLIVAVVPGLIFYASASTGEMLARSAPTLLDVGVAIASGVMGAYATARKDIPAALAGVAIAAALMPPLCTFGLELAAGRTTLGLRAGLLFLTNIVSIILAASLVFSAIGLRPPQMEASLSKRLRWLALALLLTLPAVLFSFNALRLLQRENIIRSTINGLFEQARVVSINIIDAAPLSVIITVHTAQPMHQSEALEAQTNLEDVLQQPVHVEIIAQPVLIAPYEPLAVEQE